MFKGGIDMIIRENLRPPQKKNLGLNILQKVAKLIFLIQSPFDKTISGHLFPK